MSGRPAPRAHATTVLRSVVLVLLTAVTVITSGHVHTHEHATAASNAHVVAALDAHAAEHNQDAPVAGGSHGAHGPVHAEAGARGPEVGPERGGHQDGAHAEVGVRAQQSAALAVAPAGTLGTSPQVRAGAAPLLVVRTARTPVSERSVIRT